MFTINDDLSIYVTRGDAVAFTVTSEDNGVNYVFQPGDVLRMKVFGKKDAENVVLQKEFPVFSATEEVEIFLSEQDTKIGEVISKPRDYWYEVELNPFTNPQTIIGYDDDGAKVFKLFPEGRDLTELEPDIEHEDIPVVDRELDLTSLRPVENQAIARAITKLEAATKDNKSAAKELSAQVTERDAAIRQEVAVERARIDNLVSGATADDAEVVDIRVGADGATYDSAGTAVREQFADVHDRIDGTESHVWIQSVNRFNVDEQTDDTIDPYYHDASGAATSIDSYHFTAPIPVKANTQYTVGYVPPVNIGDDDVIVPWHNAAAGCFMYDENNNMIMRTQDATFTTTADTAYIRFNYLRSNYYGLDLAQVKERCMIVVGDALPDTFSEHNDYFLDDVVNAMRSKLNEWVTPPPLHYDITDDVLTVVSKYTANKDLVTILQKKGGNNIFDFYRLGTIDNDSDVPSSDVSNMTQYLGIGTDCHAPFNVSALSNVDGNALSSSVYTGGNHAYEGIVTGRTASIRFFVDGREKTAGAGYANSIKAVWENLVQAWNTVKKDGTGREVIKERHTAVFDGLEWRETIELIPLEDVKMSVWYGLQMYGLSTVYNSVQYVGGVNRGVNDATVHSNSGDNVASKVIGYGDEHKFEMEIDPSFDLGKRTMYSGTAGIFVSDTKCYFYIIRNQELKCGSMYALKGAYRFLPV